MPKKSLAKRAVTNFAVKATPSILAHVVGNALGAGELSKITSSICTTITRVTCKDRIVMEEAIKALALIDANACDLFLRLLNDAIQVYVQSDCKDYSMVVEAVLHDPNATLEKKVEYIKDVKKQQHEHQVEMVKTIVGGVVLFRLTNAVSNATEMVASQTPKIAETVNEIDKRHEDSKRKQEQEITKRKKEEELTKRKQAEEETKRRKA